MIANESESSPNMDTSFNSNNMDGMDGNPLPIPPPENSSQYWEGKQKADVNATRLGSDGMGAANVKMTESEADYHRVMQAMSQNQKPQHTGYAPSVSSSSAPNLPVGMPASHIDVSQGLYNNNAQSFAPTEIHQLPVVGHQAAPQQAGYWNPGQSSQNEVVNAANWTYGQPQAQNWYQGSHNMPPPRDGVSSRGSHVAIDDGLRSGVTRSSGTSPDSAKKRRRNLAEDSPQRPMSGSKPQMAHRAGTHNAPRRGSDGSGYGDASMLDAAESDDVDPYGGMAAQNVAGSHMMQRSSNTSSRGR